MFLMLWMYLMLSLSSFKTTCGHKLLRSSNLSTISTNLNYVGCGACMRLVAQYDVNVVIPLLMTMFEVLNPTIQACVVIVVGYIVGFGDSLEKKK
jgi:hypothetical protein